MDALQKSLLEGDYAKQKVQIPREVVSGLLHAWL